jgi:DNA-binding NarL/FixJ family response regulator
MMARRHARSTARAVSPQDLRATRFTIAEEELIVFSFALPPLCLPPNLTAAERAVTEAIVLGGRNAQIAQERGTSVRTVATQVATIFRKLGVASRAELVELLRRTSEQAGAATTSKPTG